MSSIQQTMSRLREMRLGSMADAYEQQLQHPRLHETSFDDRLALLVEHEASQRHDRKLKRLFRAAALPEEAALEDLDAKASRGLDRAQLATLGSCDWIRRQQNLIVHGATGVGKTWLACALAGQACRLDISALFFRASALYQHWGSCTRGCAAEVQTGLGPAKLIGTGRLRYR